MVQEVPMEAGVVSLDDVADRAAERARDSHRGQMYGYLDYFSGHVVSVVDEVKSHTDDVEVWAAAFLHDAVEDSDLTLEEVRREFGDTVGDVVMLVTDPPGGSRRERKERLYHQFDTWNGLTSTLGYASLVKCCDRIVNQGTSLNFRDHEKMQMYVREFIDFVPRFAVTCTHFYGTGPMRTLISQFRRMTVITTEMSLT
jgi:(p)ppGpp synthase/HD superfamily hydrolase